MVLFRFEVKLQLKTKKKVDQRSPKIFCTARYSRNIRMRGRKERYKAVRTLQVVVEPRRCIDQAEGLAAAPGEDVALGPRLVQRRLHALQPAPTPLFEVPTFETFGSWGSHIRLGRLAQLWCEKNLMAKTAKPLRKAFRQKQTKRAKIVFGVFTAKGS